MTRTFGDASSAHASAIWDGVQRRRVATATTSCAWSTEVGPVSAEAERRERHERDPSPRAFVEHGLRRAVPEVKRVLYARDIGDAKGVEQMLEGDVAEADRRDQPVVSGRDHGRQLVIEERVRPGRSHQPQVDHRKGVDAESPQVVLDAVPQLFGRRPR